MAGYLDMASSSYAFYEDPKRFKKRYLPLEFAKNVSEPLTAFGVDYWDVLALAGVEDRSDTDAEEQVESLDMVEIASVDQAYGMGATFADDRIQVDVLHFPKQWVEQLTHTAAAHLAWARGKGDSMAPTINDNDMVLIDRSERRVEDQDLIWAFTIGDMAMIKRLRVRGDKVTIMSDNDGVSDDTAHPDEINIIGRITRVVKPV
jgi:phage repressor protein C with HTH and peptisase S24 domain